MLKKFGGISVAIVVALAVWGFQSYKDKSDAPQVGDCVSVSGTLSDLDVETASCGADDVLFKVVADDGKCDEIENTYSVERRGVKSVELCLFPEVVKGDCIDTGSDDEMESKVACAGSTDDPDVFKVLKVDYADGAATCPRRTFAMQNATRGATICMGLNT